MRNDTLVDRPTKTIGRTATLGSLLGSSRSAAVTGGAVLIVALAAVGVALRAWFYFLNTSFSVDEASLALNVMSRDVGGLLDRLDFNQAAPIGFLLLQKVITAADPTPHAFRALPLAGSIVATLLMYPVGAWMIGRRGAVLALGLFALSQPLIAYGATNKQYSTDVAVALSLFAVMSAVGTRPRLGGLAILALTGGVAVWISHPAAFILASMGVVLTLEPVRTRSTAELAPLVAVAAIWLCSFGVAYLLGRSSIEQIQHSTSTSGGTSVLGTHDHPGLVQTSGGVVRSLAGVPDVAHDTRTAFALLAVALALVGLAALIRRRRDSAILLALPAALALVASALGLYPLYPRTYLFLTPNLLLLIAASTLVLPGVRRARLAIVAGLAAIAGATVYGAIDEVRAAPDEHTPTALRDLARRARTGDSLYVYLTGQYGFRYYVECDCFGTAAEARRIKQLWRIRATGGAAQFAPALESAPRLVAGRTANAAPMAYGEDFKPLVGRSRVWIFQADASAAQDRALHAYLVDHGVERFRFSPGDTPGHASLTLMDLRHRP